MLRNLISTFKAQLWLPARRKPEGGAILNFHVNRIIGDVRLRVTASDCVTENKITQTS